MQALFFVASLDIFLRKHLTDIYTTYYTAFVQIVKKKVGNNAYNNKREMVVPNFLQEHVRVMPQITKEDCVTLEQAIKLAGVSRGTFYNYLNYLEIQRHRFPFDRKAYILNTDIVRIQKFMQSNREKPV